MTDFFTAISNFGFPIVVAVYLLIRFENKIESLSTTITDLKRSIDELKTEVISNTDRKRR